MTVDWQQRVLYSPSWSSNFPSAWLRPRLYVEHFSPGVEGSVAHPSSPGRANASYISLQNLANRLHKKQKVGSAGRVSLFSGTTSPHINGALLTSYSPIEFFNPVIPTQDFEQSRNPEGYFWHPTSRAYFQSRNPPWFCCKIANGESRPANKGNPVSRKTYWGPSTLVLQTREEREGGWRRAYQNETQYICDNFPEYE